MALHCRTHSHGVVGSLPGSSAAPISRRYDFPLCLYVLCISLKNRKKLRLSIIIFRLQFRLKSSCVRLNQMTLPAIPRKRRTSFNRQEATLDPSTRKTCWRETWGLALLQLSPGRPEAAGVTSNPGLSACAALRRLPQRMGSLARASERSRLGVCVTIAPERSRTPIALMCIQRHTRRGRKNNYRGHCSPSHHADDLFRSSFKEF